MLDVAPETRQEWTDEVAAAHKPKKIKHCSKFYFFCPTLNAKVHGDTCAINKALKNPSLTNKKCKDCKGIPKGVEKVSEATFHAQVASDMKASQAAQKQTNSRVPYTVRGFMESQRIGRMLSDVKKG